MVVGTVRRMPVDVTLSGCLIVRDEETRLAACLASVAPFVDEVVVADTGSLDGTVDVARRAGARVVEVPWTDDFAAARNRATSACAGEWVLSVDADAVVAGDPQALRDVLARTEASALSVEIREVDGPNPRGMTSHRAVQLFRRTEGVWRGRVHEEVVARGEEPLAVAPAPDGVVTLVHSGYADPAVFAAKVARNLRLARLEASDLDAAGADDARRLPALLDLGRSELAAGLRDEGSTTLMLVRDLSGSGTRAWVWATDFLAWDAVRHGESDRAWELLDELTAHVEGIDHARPLVERLLGLAP